jgi:hypothetical protein
MGLERLPPIFWRLFGNVRAAGSDGALAGEWIGFGVPVGVGSMTQPVRRQAAVRRERRSGLTSAPPVTPPCEVLRPTGFACRARGQEYTPIKSRSGSGPWLTKMPAHPLEEKPPVTSKRLTSSPSRGSWLRAGCPRRHGLRAFRRPARAAPADTGRRPAQAGRVAGGRRSALRRSFSRSAGRGSWQAPARRSDAGTLTGPGRRRR